MATLSTDERLALQQARLRAMRERVVQETYLKVTEVAKHFGVARSTIEDLPIEVLPYTDMRPFSEKAYRRYSPAEVMAAGVRIRRYLKAKAEGRGEAYLRELREERAAEDEAILAFARDIRKDVA
jgi:hypothetical protein